MIAPFGCLNHLYLTEVLAYEAHSPCNGSIFNRPVRPGSTQDGTGWCHAVRPRVGRKRRRHFESGRERTHETAGDEQCRPQPSPIDIHGYFSVYNNSHIKLVTLILTLKQGPSASVPSVLCLIEALLIYVLYIDASIISFAARSQGLIQFHLNIFVTAR